MLAPRKQLVLDKYQHLDLTAKGMIMEMIDGKEAWVGSIIIQGNPLE